MQITICTLVHLAFKGERFNVANQALSIALGDKYTLIDATLDDLRAASSLIEKNLTEQEERAMQPDFLTGEMPSDEDQMRAITVINETAEQIRAVFYEIVRMHESAVRPCSRCGYEGTGWLDDGAACPQCKLVQ